MDRLEPDRPTGRTRARKRINHEEAYSMDDACTNWAEESFSRMRSAEIGIHHHIAGAYRAVCSREVLERGQPPSVERSASQPPRSFVFEAWQVS